MDYDDFSRLTGSILHGVGWKAMPDPHSIAFQATPEPLATSMPIGGMASAALGALASVLMEIHVARGGKMGGITVDRRASALAMCANDFLRLDGETPVSWPELSGFYQASDAWVFLHGGFPPHAIKLVAALNAPNDRQGLAARVANMKAQEIEDICVAANTCGRRLRSAEEWTDHPASDAIAAQPVIDVRPLGHGPVQGWTPADKPLQGVRVLDLSRVRQGQPSDAPSPNTAPMSCGSPRQTCRSSNP